MSTATASGIPSLLQQTLPLLQEHTRQLIPIVPGASLDPRLVCSGAFVATNMILREGHPVGLYRFPNYETILAEIETLFTPSQERLLVFTAGVLEHVIQLTQTTPQPKTNKPANPVTWNAGRYHDPVPTIVHPLMLASTHLPGTREFVVTAHVASHLLDRAIALQWTKFNAIQSFLYLAMIALQSIAKTPHDWEMRHELIANVVGRNPLRTGTYLVSVALRLEFHLEAQRETSSELLQG